MWFQLGAVDIVNLGVFFGLSISSYAMLYFSQKASLEKRVTSSVFTLALGLNMIGLSSLFRIGIEKFLPIFNIITASLGTVCSLVGVVMVFYERAYKVKDIKSRYEEVKAIISNLKEKYYKQEISEEDLKSTNASLLRELAELEVKLKKKK
jgi:uncharacterized membrane protein